MRKQCTAVVLLLLLFITSCNEQSNKADGLETETNELILVELSNNVDYVPLSTKSFESGDLAAIQIYDITDGEVGYANGLFSSINGVSFIGTSGSTYRVVMTVVKSATTTIYNLNGLYGKPLSAYLTNAFNYTTDIFSDLSESGAQLTDNKEYTIPNIDRYYCTVEKLVTKDDSVIPIYLKRVSFGISNDLQGSYSGEILLELSGAPALTIDSNSGSYTIFTFSDILAAYNSDETLAAYQESISTKVTVGGYEAFNDVVSYKRNQAAILKYDSSNDPSSPSFDVEFEDGFDDVIYTVSFEDEDGSTTWSSLVPTSQDSTNSLLYGSTQYTWSDTNSGLSGQVNVNDYNTDAFAYYSGGVVVSNYYNEISSATISSQLSVPYKDSSTGYCGNEGSKNFAVVFDAVTSSGGQYETALFFAAGVEATIKSMYVANTSFTSSVCQSGYAYSEALGATDWLAVIATGYDASGVTTGSSTLYLAKDGAIIEGWNLWSLSNLGKINKVVFQINSSVVNENGISTIPNFVAIDDITVKL